MKKLPLKIKPIDEKNIIVAGIVCNEPEYKVCWLLNACLNKNLTSIPDIEIFKKDKSLEKYSIYKHCVDEYLYNIYLIQNKGENGFFLDKIKNIDFILVLKGDEVEKHSISIMSKLKTNQDFTIISLSNTALKNYEEKLNLLE